MHETFPPIYYAGFEVGSGLSGLTIVPTDDMPLPQDLVTLPSFIANGNIATLLKGADAEATLSDVLRPDEYVLTWQNRTYFLHRLLAQGTFLYNAFSDERRYWSTHAHLLLLCLACILIPHSRFELRLVTALPVSLYTRERRLKVRSALSGFYRFTFNGREREVVVKCGYVAMEGQGILIHRGDTSSQQAVIDIGERTTDLVAANGQRLLGLLCKGEQFGVGHLVEELKELAHQHRRAISVEQAHDLLKAYAHHLPYPTISTPTGSLPTEEITMAIHESIQRIAGPLSSFLVGTWNMEDVPAGSQFDTIYLGGGGAYYFEDVVRSALPDCYIVTVPDPQDANIRGYAELATALDAYRWEIN